MNNVHIDVKRIEFSITKTCGGKCKHCSVGVCDKNESIDTEAAVNLIKQLTGRYAVDSLMTFGGEPLLYADKVCQIHSTARDCGIPLRQVITNGFFTRDDKKINDTAAALVDSGVSEILLSVDAFHQEHIPVEPVILFAEALLKNGFQNLRVHPAWLVNKENDNAYNNETKRLLRLFTKMGIKVSNGNNIFPSGNAVKYLSEYFPRPENVDLSVLCGQMPYTGRLDEVGGVSVNPNGDVIGCAFTIGNIYKNDILEILNHYNPHENAAMKALLDGGVIKLLQYAEERGVKIDTSDCFSACGVCRKVVAALC